MSCLFLSFAICIFIHISSRIACVVHSWFAVKCYVLGYAVKVLCLIDFIARLLVLSVRWDCHRQCLWCFFIAIAIARVHLNHLIHVDSVPRGSSCRPSQSTWAVSPFVGYLSVIGCRNSFGPSVITRTLLVVWQEGHLACYKNHSRDQTPFRRGQLAASLGESWLSELSCVCV